MGASTGLLLSYSLHLVQHNGLRKAHIVADRCSVVRGFSRGTRLLLNGQVRGLLKKEVHTRSCSCTNTRECVVVVVVALDRQQQIAVRDGMEIATVDPPETVIAVHTYEGEGSHTHKH